MSRSQCPRGLRHTAYYDCWFESRRGHGCLSFMSAVCCQVEAPASGWSPTECDVSRCDVGALIRRGP
jgi:hypothetical protein